MDRASLERERTGAQDLKTVGKHIIFTNRWKRKFESVENSCLRSNFCQLGKAIRIVPKSHVSSLMSGSARSCAVVFVHEGCLHT